MKVGIIADDLTGANATGVRLSKVGFTSATIVYRDKIPDSHKLDAVCIDTDTRYLPKQQITNRIHKAMESFREWDAKIICKRIDSTIRGNIGYEIDTVLQEVGDDSIAVVVPSFPDSGRITSGGYLLVDGIPVQETDVAQDPITPIVDSCVPKVIQQQSHHKVEHIGLDKVLAGIESLNQSLLSAINSGNRIIVIDAVTDEDIEIIAETMLTIKGFNLIPTDPGPLTAAYSQAFFNQHVNPGKVIVSVGSVTALTKSQLSYLKSKTNSTPIYVSAEKLATFGVSWEEEVERATFEAMNRIHQDDVLIITTNIEGTEKQINLKAIAEKYHSTEDALAKRITDGLAKITRIVMQQTRYLIQGCFTSGGDVTASMCAVCNASGIKLIDEVLPLTAFGKMIDGRFPNLPIVTKGGMIGDKKSIYTAVKYLQTTKTKG
ncbi:four-carbon acid sugar kinase family protein [Oceanobacillus manasiensis]|uniref:four-carbon acid sugar kinase family protein n=1 Tax=Oceanobacillus manasiensis TaxID=586413 RepID=UPI0005AA5E36|nr:four-carbon acid sugar kinase family protein [Oceanobacillus manasiensis]